ncbi:5'/3'-nucleotidase SurE [Photobacterium swingsii]|uniref:5'-nucleotidase SurE n=1 Tax=Photobacterium swingsii TaxID=680026 RepID=A0A0J8XU52_9GAMM|nr:5'/3'-nucleotidase SurE [Photobacterium swingsii]KMV28884.1 stationary phase survival protein SurE [Photobacterium swingsii]PSW21616.1 5'/3'-nucleotidase SurE [Photobacterium swingsii]
MRILISNDDGIFAEGINTLATALAELGEVVVVAPDRNRSGASNSLTLDIPLRIREEGQGRISVEGTPTDCVHFALNEWLDYRPDLVVAGINHGANLGDDVLYSGTVAAATEGHFLGVPAIAVSLVGKTHFATAAQVVKEVIENMQSSPLPTNKILNINVPDRPYAELQSWQVTRLGARHRAEDMVKETDPRGKTVYWLGPPGACQDAGPGTDFYAIEQGAVSITPLQVDLTAHDAIAGMKQWMQDVEIN